MYILFGLYSGLTMKHLKGKSDFFEGVGGRFAFRLAVFLAFCYSLRLRSDPLRCSYSPPPRLRLRLRYSLRIEPAYSPAPPRYNRETNININSRPAPPFVSLKTLKNFVKPFEIRGYNHPMNYKPYKLRELDRCEAPQTLRKQTFFENN